MKSPKNIDQTANIWRWLKVSYLLLPPKGPRVPSEMMRLSWPGAKVNTMHHQPLYPPLFGAINMKKTPWKWFKQTTNWPTNQSTYLSGEKNGRNRTAPGHCLHAVFSANLSRSHGVQRHHSLCRSDFFLNEVNWHCDEQSQIYTRIIQNTHIPNDHRVYKPLVVYSSSLFGCVQPVIWGSIILDNRLTIKAENFSASTHVAAA